MVQYIDIYIYRYINISKIYCGHIKTAGNHLSGQSWIFLLSFILLLYGKKIGTQFLPFELLFLFFIRPNKYNLKDGSDYGRNAAKKIKRENKSTILYHIVFFECVKIRWHIFFGIKNICALFADLCHLFFSAILDIRKYVFFN